MKIAFIKTRAANVKSCLIYLFIYSIYLVAHKTLYNMNKTC